FVMDFLGRANHLRARMAHGGAGWGAVGNGNGFGLPVDDSAHWAEGEDVGLAFRPEAAVARPAAGGGAWGGGVRSSVYVGGRAEYVVDLGGVTVRATGPVYPRLPHESRAEVTVSPRAVRLWPAPEGERQ